MRKLSTIIAALLLAPLTALPQDTGGYVCTYGEMTRRVVIMTEPGVAVPCEVHYYKDTEAPGETEVLWSAENDAGYCQRKAEEFVQKLDGWGWSCSSGGGAMEGSVDESMESGMMDVPPEPAMDEGMEDGVKDAMDDSGALQPAETDAD